tara:strand:+ start:320 stop:457 length:138 start_codon:yes stop_codon:yes gene_type:complete
MSSEVSSIGITHENKNNNIICPPFSNYGEKNKKGQKRELMAIGGE